PPRAAARDQHALGEKPILDADQEYLSGALSQELAFHHRARFDRHLLLSAMGAQLAEGFLVLGPELETRDGQTQSDPKTADGGWRIHGELVQLRSGQQAR